MTTDDKNGQRLFIPTQELEKKEQERAREIELEEKQNSLLITSFGSFIRSLWQEAYDARQAIDEVMLTAMRMRNGLYSSQESARHAVNGEPSLFVGLTGVKCRSAEHWMREIITGQGEPPWDIEPTPIPDLPPERQEDVKQRLAEKIGKVITKDQVVLSDAEKRQLAEEESMEAMKEEAQHRVNKMKKLIEDQLVHGGWSHALDEFITDLVTFPCAFIKGPVIRYQHKMSYTEDGVGAETILAPEFERVDPFHIYPEPGITHIEDGYIFEYHMMSRADLAALLGLEGYDQDVLRALLMEKPSLTWAIDRVSEEKRIQERKDSGYLCNNMYDMLEFWGTVSGQMLIEWGMTDGGGGQGGIDPAKEYPVNVWLIGRYVLKVVINPDPLHEKPYIKTSYMKTPGAFWGKSIPEIIEGPQKVCNAAARSVVRNMAISSGPQVDVDTERLATGQNEITQVYPGKIWQTKSSGTGGNSPAVRFFQPIDNSASILGVFDKFSQLADDHSGVPSYAHGDISVTGAGRTASGLSMLLGEAGRGIRQVVAYVDEDIIKPVIWRLFVYNMQTSPDRSIKGDLVVVPKGVTNLANMEATSGRLLDFMNATQNDVDLQILGPEGRGNLLRAVARSLNIPDDVVPTEVKQDAIMGGQAPSPQGVGELDAAGNPKGETTAVGPNVVDNTGG